MALASDYWTVVGDTLCHTYLEAIIEPENQLLRTMFLMDLNATIRRLQSSDVHEEEIIEDNVRISENQDSIELQYNPNDNFLRDLQGVALSKKLQELQVPILGLEARWFMPACALPIEKLGRTGAEVLSTVSSEATLMPCLHIYRGGCIV
ncbi:hypothetical protein ACLB2K_029070 [Fragaria x ananassa]